MQRLTEQILAHTEGLPEGAPIAAKSLLHLGNRAAVDQALSRLAERGRLMRAGRGVYLRPVSSRFGVRAPSVEKAVEALALQRGETIVSNGAAAANALGLTTQVPVRSVYLTSGRSRTMNLGQQVVELRHAPRWQLALADRPAGQAVRALAWLGPEKAEAALMTLKRKLPSSTFGELVAVAPQLPSWLARTVGKVAYGRRSHSQVGGLPIQIVRNLYIYFGQSTWFASEKGLQFSDMNTDSPDLKKAMLERIRADAPRKVWTPSDFVDLASRDAVDKALQRLTKVEILRRIDRGLYDQPGFNKLTQKPNPPDPRSVIDAVGRRDQTRMLVDGMTAANDLGLTDAVPAKIVVHTDARRRAIKLGNVTITFRPTAASKLFWAGRPAMRVVQALHWLRDLLVREGESDQVRRKLANLFEDPTVGPPLKADLTAGMTALPTWMWVFLKPLVESDAGVRRRHVDDDRDDADHDRHQQRTADDADDQRHAAVARPKRKPLSPQKAQTAKRGAARAVKT